MNVQPPSRTLPIRALLVAASLAIFGQMNVGDAEAQTPAANVTAPNAPATTTAPASGDPTGDPKRGFTRAATCLGCHAIPGYKADFPVVYSVPMIGGQNAKYIEAALKEYRKGDRRFPSMMATARSLSDQDIADLAAYFSSQH